MGSKERHRGENNLFNIYGYETEKNITKYFKSTPSFNKTKNKSNLSLKLKLLLIIIAKIIIKENQKHKYFLNIL